MTVKIASDCLYSVHFEALTGCWEVDPQFNLAMLSQPVELEGEVTLQNLLDLVDANPVLRHFVTGFFGVSVDTLQASQNIDPHRLDVQPAHLEVSRSAMVSNDDLKIGYTLQAIKRDPHFYSLDVATTAFANFKDLPIKIDPEFWICDKSGFMIQGQRGFTLLELLEASIGNFVAGRPRWSPNQVQAFDDVEFQTKRWVQKQLENLIYQQLDHPGPAVAVQSVRGPWDTPERPLSLPSHAPADLGNVNACLN